jgi:SPP1 gp7 family putative phage head morphogenesis protein
MSLDAIIEELSEETDSLIDDYAQGIVDSAQESPRETEELPTELVLALIALWETAVDNIAAEAVTETNRQLDQDDDGNITEEEKARYKTVGGYFFLEAMRRSFNRIHGTAIALQITEEDREQEIQDAITRSKKDVSDSAFTELAFAYGAFVQREQLARGIQSYRWQTFGDTRVRPTHRANEGRIFSWQNAPATGHPGSDHNCRCSAIPQPIEGNNQPMKAKITLVKGDELKTFQSNFKVKALSANKVGIDINGEIGQFSDDFTTEWEIKNWSGIDDSTTDIELTINSSGGDFFEGMAIYKFLKSHPAKVTATVNGFAASAATFPLLAADVRRVPAGSIVGVHYPFSAACFCDLNHEQAQLLADQFKPFSDVMVDIYTSELRISESEVREMLSREEAMTSSRALEVGFATAIIPDEDDVTDEILNNRLSLVRADMRSVEARFVKSVKDGENQMSKTPSDSGGVTVETIQAKYDVLAHKNTELESENETLKAQVEQLQNGEAELRASVKAEVLAEQNLIADVQAKARDIDAKAEGETADEMMRSVIVAKGVKNPKAFKGDALQSIFEHVVAQYGSQQADDVYSGDDKSDNSDKSKGKKDPWARANAAV